MVIAHALAAVEVGGYASWWKAAILLLLLLVWARLLTWIDKDADATYLPRVAINSGLLATLIVTLLTSLFLPRFWMTALAIPAAMTLSTAVYLAMRQKKVGLGDLKKQFNDWIHGFGKKDESKLVEVKNLVQFLNKAGGGITAPSAEDPSRAGYDALQTALFDPLAKGGDRIDINPSDQAVGVKFAIDGMVYRGSVLERNAAATAITLIKEYAGLDAADRRKPQTGMLRAAVNGKKHDLQVTTMGTTAGESLVIEVNPKKRHAFTLDSLGMAADQLETVQASIADNSGIVLVSAPKGMGMTSTLYGLLRGHDAFLQHIITLERNASTDLDGITQNKLARVPPPGEETRQVEWMCSQEPDVLMVDQIDEASAAKALIDYARGGKRRIYVGVRAGTTFEGIAAWQRVVGDAKLAVSQLDLAIACRVLRTLCGACKVGYVPDRAQLMKLNMDPEHVTKLYRARSEPMRNDKGQPVLCEFCQELYYRGRTGVYEVFKVDDEVRQMLATGATATTIRGAFRKQKSMLLQESGLALVEGGSTSVQEVLRVLKPATDQPVSVPRASQDSQPPAGADGSRGSRGVEGSAPAM